MRRVRWSIGIAVWGLAVVALTAGAGARQSATGWKIPENAAAEKNPLTVNDAVLTAGKRFFGMHCESCHGPQGKGDGPDADPNYKRAMDLTRADRASVNPDGVVFYKAWNGRSSPKMPAFGEDLPKEQVWAIVAYVQTLRQK
jgi:mono/diheme cytochrome c family protein